MSTEVSKKIRNLRRKRGAARNRGRRNSLEVVVDRRKGVAAVGGHGDNFKELVSGKGTSSRRRYYVKPIRNASAQVLYTALRVAKKQIDTY